MIIFEWDKVKDAANRRKHGVSFDLATRVFLDPSHVTAFDRIVDGEERFHAVGMIDAVALLLVVHSYRDDQRGEVIRIISARRPTRRERWVYEQQNG